MRGAGSALKEGLAPGRTDRAGALRNNLCFLPACLPACLCHSAGGGLSSSAAIVCSSSLAVMRMHGIELTKGVSPALPVPTRGCRHCRCQADAAAPPPPLPAPSPCPARCPARLWVCRGGGVQLSGHRLRICAGNHHGTRAQVLQTGLCRANTAPGGMRAAAAPHKPTSPPTRTGPPAHTAHPRHMPITNPI